MSLPNFFILGAARCGTTSLYRYLERHPDIFMSSPKEPTFFEAEWAKGPDYYRDRYFAGWQGESAVGEARAANLFLPYVPERIHRLAPAARLIVMLRDPVQRAYSNWHLTRLNGLEKAGFSEAIADNLASLEAGRTFAGESGERLWCERSMLGADREGMRVYVDVGHYDEQLARYRELYEPQQMKIIWFEEFTRDPAAVVRDTWRFLGVDPHHEVPELRAHNISLHASFRPLFRLARFLRLSSFLSPRATAGLRRTASRLLPAAPVEASVEASLREHYAPHNRELESLLQVDLGHWG